MLFLRFARKTPIGRLDVGAGGQDERRRIVIEGRAVAEKPLVLSGSQSRPIWYDMSVEAFQTPSRGRGRAMWQPSAAEERVTPFHLEDASGRAWIAAERGAVRVSGGRREVGQAGKRATGRYVARLFEEGAVVRIRGMVRQAVRAEPDGTVVYGTPERPLEILVRKHATPSAK
jgi:hypothetical protein